MFLYDSLKKVYVLVIFWNPRWPSQQDKILT